MEAVTGYPLPSTDIAKEVKKYVYSKLDSYQEFPGLIEGGIGESEGEFLSSLIEISNSATIIEIGVAAGVSSAWMLETITRMGGDRVLYSFDLAERYYANIKYPLCFVALDIGSSNEFNHKIFGGKNSFDIGGIVSLSNRNVDLAFIDAQHCHPFPSLDTLALLGVVRDGGWIVHHDVNLNVVMNQNVSYGHHIFSKSWDSFKLVNDAPMALIAGFKKPSDNSSCVSSILKALDFPWEYSPTQVELARYLKAAQSVISEDQNKELISIIENRSGIPREFWVDLSA